MSEFNTTPMMNFMEYDISKGEFKTINTFKKSADSETDERFYGFIEGYISTPHIDRENERFTSKALKGAVKSVLQNPAVFFNHAHREIPIGLVVGADYRKGKGIWTKVGISKGGEKQQEIWNAIKDGRLSAFSIYGVIDPEYAQWVTDDELGKEFMEYDKLDIWESSVVSLPANPSAQFSMTKGLEVIVKEFSKQIRERDENKMVNEAIEKLKAENEALLKQLGGLKTDLTEKDSKETELLNSLAKMKEDRIKLIALNETAMKKMDTFVDEFKKADEERYKSKAQRETGERTTDENVITFKTQKEARQYQIQKLWEIITGENSYRVDMYADVTAKTPNYTQYRREAQERMGVYHL